MQLTEKIRATIRNVQDYPKPGIQFKDITPVLANPTLVSEIVSALHDTWSSQRLDAIVAVEARGFIFGSMLAHSLGLPFIPVRKAGKLPFTTRRQKYDLEYGTAEIEIHTDAIKPGWRVLIHDDVLATGGTAVAAAHLVKDSGGEVAGFSFLINLAFLNGAAVLRDRFGVVPNAMIEF